MRILILDDDAPFAHMLRGQLERLEPAFNAEAVATAEAARAAVRDTTEPFDVFLLDQRLDGSDVDGITLMGELKRASSTSDAIIVTGYDDQDAGLRAFDAGAYRYLTKPFDTRELISILKVLRNDRKTRRERDWLHILAEITSEMQGTDDISTLASIIVRGGLRFGFQRTRLRLFEHEGQQAVPDPEMVGISQAGSPELTGFEGLRAPLSKLIYSQRAIVSGLPVVFHGRDLGPGGNDEFFAAQSVPLPKGDWFKIPLLSGGQPIGALTLDNSDEERTVSHQLRSQLTQVLDLFGTQAAAALERARLHEQARCQAEQAEAATQEAKTLSDIGRQVTTKAATGDLNALLDEVRRQVGNLMEVTNLMVVLSDLETGALDFRRQYEETNLEGKPEDRHWRSGDAGLSGYVITRNEAVLTGDTEAFRARHSIAPYGPPAHCWLGVPLQVDGHAKGALVVQSYQDKSAYTERHKRLLSMIADQVAGAIHLAYQLEREEELKRQTEALEALKRVMPNLIKESEDVFWHVVLTTITHKDGNSFNRAALFWYDDAGEHLLGRMGIGHFSRHDARQAWERDLAAEHTLMKYFAVPHRALSAPTPLQEMVVGQRWPIGAPHSPCYRVWSEGTKLTCNSGELRGCLPDKILYPPDLWDDRRTYACALLPVRSNDDSVGLLIVDNAFDGEPLRPDDLNSLERMLETAMQVWLQAEETSRTQRLGERYEAVLTLERQITAQAATGHLKESLEQLCQGSQLLTKADCVVIYPYRTSSGSYDSERVSSIGLKHAGEFRAKNKPRQQGVTFTVLQSGPLIVPDVSRSTLSFGDHRLAEHDFLDREEIKALIAVPIRHAATGEPLGVIYFDYRSTQKFGDQHIALAEHIAAIGAIAINYGREMERQTQGRTAAERSEQQRRRDMQLLSNIQTQALASDTDMDKTVRAILQNAAELFHRSVRATLTLLDWEDSGPRRQQERWDYHLTRQGRLQRKRVERDLGLIGQAMDQPTSCLTDNAIACSIRRGQQSIGAILLEKGAGIMPFAPEDAEIVQRLTTVAALALDNVRTRANLTLVSRTVGVVVDPEGLEKTLERVVNFAHQVAPDIDCITLWYKDAESEELIPGPNRGITREKHQRSSANTSRIVRDVMRRRTPLFAPVAARKRCLNGEFIVDERIESVAAFPLRFGAERQAFGVLFLNYRKFHEFTLAEQKLFKTFADAAATAINSAQAYELAERRRKRLGTALAVANTASANLDLDEVLREILTALRNEFQRNPEDDDTTPYIMLFDDRDRVLELPSVARDFYQPDRLEYRERVRLPLGGPGITTRTARRALAERKIIVDNIKNVHNDPDYVEVHSTTKSEICAGLVSEKRLLGTLVIKSARLAAFGAEDEELFRTAAYQVTMTLDWLEREARAQRNASVAGAVAWAADIAHDLDSTVGIIRNRAYWLQQREDGLSRQGKQWAGEIDEYAAQIAHMAHNVGSQRDEPECFALEEMLREKIENWKSTRAVQVASEVNTTEPCMVGAQREQLWRAIRHLLRNAVEAMEAAGGPHREIRVRLLSSEQNQVEIQIEDTGPGIAEEARRRLFREPYSTKATRGRDRGLGLLLAQWLIESMNGSIYLYPPEPGRGARFGIRLPLAAQEEERHV